jgi:4-amino-4-deoxy-L-arabinose transferase-like glycosyltransferase
VFTWWSADVGLPLTLANVLEDVHGPLYCLLLHLWTRIAGDSEWALRLPSVLAGAATVPALAWLARRWLGRETAVWAAWLAALSPFLVWYSQEARNYALLMLCTVLASGALIGLTRAPRVRTMLGYAVASAAALLSNLSYALLVPAHLVWWWKRTGGGGHTLRWALVAGLLVVLAVLPWAPRVSQVWDWSRLAPGRGPVEGEVPLRGETTLHVGAVPFTLHAFAVGYTFGPGLRELRAEPTTATLRRHAPALGATVLVFGLLGLLGLRALARRGVLVEALAWMLVPLAILTWFSASNFKVFHPRYLMVCLPGVLLALAAGLADAPRRARIALGLGVAAIWAVSLANHFFVPRYAKEDLRSAAATVRSRAAADERIISVNTDDLLAYYYRGPLPVRQVWLGYAAVPARLDRALGQAMADAGGAWVVLSRPEDLDPSGAFARRFETLHPDAERFAFEGVRVWHVRFRPAGP